jgi:hypothetical protein
MRILNKCLALVSGSGRAFRVAGYLRVVRLLALHARFALAELRVHIWRAGRARAMVKLQFAALGGCRCRLLRAVRIGGALDLLGLGGCRLLLRMRWHG